jgi:hypothetical protein
MSIRRIAFAAVALALCTASAQADVTITIEQVGSDVVASGSGTINLADLTFGSTQSGLLGINPSIATIREGTLLFPPNVTIDIYSGQSGPTSFGPGGGFPVPTSGTGDAFGIVGAAGQFSGIEVPHNYVSGTHLTATDTYANQTFSSIGLTPGTYTWHWGTGANADSFTIQIGPTATAVPEPSTALAVGFAALAGLGVWARRRRAARGV